MTTRVHCRQAPYDVYIGRPGSWGNPFKIGQDGTREEVILKFREYLRAHPALVAQAREELKDKVLGCWCRPDQPCHGDVWIELCDIK